MNLTRIDTRAAAEAGHVGDALTLLPFIPAGSQRIADIGPLSSIYEQAVLALLEDQ